MTDVKQTLMVVDISTVDSLKPKEKTRIACWNVTIIFEQDLATLFQCRDICKKTWTSPSHLNPDRPHSDQRKMEKLPYKMQVPTEEHVSLKLRKALRGQRRGHQFDSSELRDDQIRQAFRRELKNRFQILGEEHKMNISSFNQAFKEAGEKEEGGMDTRGDLEENRNKERSQAANELHPGGMCP